MKYKSTYILMITMMLSAALYSCGDSGNEEDGSGNGNGNGEEPGNEYVFEFKVDYDDRTYSTGEEIAFKFDGNPDEIHFYTGEPGSRYEFRNEGERFVVEKVEMSFGSQISNLGDGRSCERYIYISDDFSGDVLDESAIRAATWRDITDEFILATNNTRVYSGFVNLSQFIRDEKPFHVAFNYINAPYTTTGPPPSFRIYEFLLEMTLEDGETFEFISSEKGLVGEFVVHDFQADDKKGANNVGGNYIGMQPTNAGPLDSHEVWVISKQINGSYVALEPETGVVVKYSYERIPQKYTYKFEEAGTYEAVFLGRNLVDGEEIECPLKIVVN